MKIKYLLLIGLLSQLAACGGGGGGDAPVLPLASGSLDTSFGNNGIVITNLDSDSEFASSLGIQADGKLVVSGLDLLGQQDDFVLARYHGADGSLDISFDNDGIVTTDFVGGIAGIFNLAIQADDKIVAAGIYVDPTSGNGFDFGLARYHSTDGSLDTGFRNNGTLRTNLTGMDEARAVALQSGGAIVVAGTTDTTNGTQNFVVVRYDTAGNLDTTFSPANVAGVERTDFNGGDDYANAIAIDNSDRIVVAGESDGHMALVRYGVDGGLDPTFGPNFDGKVITQQGNSSEVFALAVQRNGKILTVGTANHGGVIGDAIVIARYLDNGSLDTTSFGVLGLSIHDLGSSGEESGYDVAIQADGKIVVTGAAPNNGADQLVVLRLNKDGTSDTDFGTGGIVIPSIPNSTKSAGTAIGIQDDGKIVVAGGTIDNNNLTDAVLLRINP